MGDTDSSSRTSKGPVCYYLDRLSEQPNSCTKLRALRTVLIRSKNKGYRGFVNIYRKYVLDCFPADEISEHSKDVIGEYLQNNWFNHDGWWPQLQPIEPAFCLGVVEALTRAIQKCPGAGSGKKTKAMPIDSYWVVADQGFEVVVSRNARQVTLMYLTPRPPKPRAPGVWAPATEIWSVRDAGPSDSQTLWERENGDGLVQASGTVLTSKVRPRS